MESESPASGGSVEVTGWSPSEADRARDARSALEQLKGLVIEEVDHGKPPTPHSSTMAQFSPSEFTKGKESPRKKAYESTAAPALGIYEATTESAQAPQNLPPGLVHELDRIQNESRALLENMNRMEQEYDMKLSASRMASRGKSPIAIDTKVNTPLGAAKATPFRVSTTQRSAQPKSSSRRGAPLSSKPATTTQKGRQNQTPNVRSQAFHLKPGQKRARQGFLSTQRARAAPTTRAGRAATQRVVASSPQNNDDRFSKPLHRPTTPSEETRVRAELRSLRNDVERLRSATVVRSSLQEVESSATDLIEKFPNLRNTIATMEGETRRASDLLQHRIQTLVKSYRDMSSMAARTPVSFLSAMDPHDTLSGKAKKRPEWMPRLKDKFDHELLQAEAQDIRMQRRIIEDTLAKLDDLVSGESVPFPSSQNHTERLAAQVSTRVQRANNEIARFVDHSFAYRKQQTRGPLRGSKHPYNPHLSPWMEPSKYSELSGNKRFVKPPKMPKILQLAIDRMEEQVDETDDTRREWERKKWADKAAQNARPHYEKPLDRKKTKKSDTPKQREVKRRSGAISPPKSSAAERERGRRGGEGGRGGLKAGSKPRAKKTNEKEVDSVEPEADDGASVDSISAFLNRLEDRRNTQDAFEASERAKGSPDRRRLPGKVKSRVKTTDTRTTGVKGEGGRDEDAQAGAKAPALRAEQLLVDKSADPDKHTSPADQSMDFAKQAISNRFKTLVESLGHPHLVSLKAAYSTCRNMFAQTQGLGSFEAIGASLFIAQVCYGQVFRLCQTALFRVVTEELVKAELLGALSEADLSQFLVLLDCDPLHQATCRRLSGPCALAVVSCAFQAASLENTQASTGARDALAQQFLAFANKYAVLDNLSAFNEAMDSAVQAARAIHLGMANRHPSTRVAAALQVSESAFHEIAGSLPNMMLQAAIQALAHADDQSTPTLSELELSFLHAGICNHETRNGRLVSPTMQVALRSIIASVAETRQLVYRAVAGAAPSLTLGGGTKDDDVLGPPPMPDYKDVVTMASSAFQRRAPITESSSEITSLLEDQTSLTGFAFSALCNLLGRSEQDGSQEQRELNAASARLAVDTAAEVAFQTGAARHISSDAEGLVAIHTVSNAVQTTLSTAVTNGTMRLKKEEETAIRHPAALEEKISRIDLKGEAGVVLAESPRALAVIEEGEAHQQPNRLQATEKQVLDYVSSAALAEILVSEQSKALIPRDHSSEPALEGSLLNGAVVQWFVDQGLKVGSDQVQEAARLAISSALGEPPQSASALRRVSEPPNDMFWSEERVLDLVTHLFLEQQRAEKELAGLEKNGQQEQQGGSEEETDVVVVVAQAKTADPPAENTDSRLSTELAMAKEAAASALASRLAAESAERSVAARQVELERQEKMLESKRRQVHDMQVAAEQGISQAQLDARVEQVEKMEQSIKAREDVYEKIENTRMVHLESTLEKISEMQSSAFVAAFERIGGLFSQERVQESEATTSSVLGDSIQQTDDLVVDQMDVATQSEVECKESETQVEQIDQQVAAPLQLEGGGEEEEEEEEEETVVVEDEKDENKDAAKAPLKQQESQVEKEDETHDKMNAESIAEQEKTDLGEDSARVEARFVDLGSFVLQEPLRPKPTGFTSTLLDWSDSDHSDKSSQASESSHGSDLSEGQLNVLPGDLSDGEEVPLTLAYTSSSQRKLLPPFTKPPWDVGQGPDSKLLSKILGGKSVPKAQVVHTLSQGDVGNQAAGGGDDDNDDIDASLSDGSASSLGSALLKD